MVRGAIGSVRSAWSCDGVNPNGLLSQPEKADARTAIVSARLMLGGFIIGGATHIRFSRHLSPRISSPIGKDGPRQKPAPAVIHEASGRLLLRLSGSCVLLGGFEDASISCTDELHFLI